jgi:hypothetical protein
LRVIRVIVDLLLALPVMLVIDQRIPERDLVWTYAPSPTCLTYRCRRIRRFHYMLCNPPYGVDWSKYQDPIKNEHETPGESGRFSAGSHAFRTVSCCSFST